MSEPGVSDIIGTLPGARLRPVDDIDGAIGLASATKGSPVADAAEAALVLARRVVELEARGRGLFIELKAPGGSLNPQQSDFLAKMESAGAVAFCARSPVSVVEKLAESGYDPARRMHIQFPGGGLGS